MIILYNYYLSPSLLYFLHAHVHQCMLLLLTTVSPPLN